MEIERKGQNGDKKMVRMSAEKVREREQVAQGQYVVSDTRCPALHGCESEWGEQGSGPERDKVLQNTGGLSFICPSVRLG